MWKQCIENILDEGGINLLLHQINMSKVCHQCEYNYNTQKSNASDH